MKERLLAFWDAVKAWWEQLSRIGRTIFLVTGGVIIIAIICLVALSSQKEPEYALLYNDLSTTETAKVLSILSENLISPKVEPDGSIYVNVADADKARMQLATAGFQGQIFDYSTYSPGMTATQSDKDRLDRWQTQDRLQAQIETMEEVAQAVVNLTVPERNAFALESDVIEPSAAVTLTMRPNQTLSSQQIQGIINTVQHSVQGLSADRISITDQNGDVKARLDNNVDTNNNKLKLKEEFDEVNRKKVLSIVQPMFGPGNVEVQVNSMLDTDESTAQKITYHPFDEENPLNNPADYVEWIREKNGPEDAIVEGVVGANDNVQTPQYGEEEGDLEGLSSYNTHDIYDYLVSSTNEQISRNGFTVTDMSVAVVVNEANLADGVRDQIISLAAHAAGVEPEKVSVVNYKFFTPDELEGGGTQPEPIATWMIIVGIILLVIIICLIIVAFLLAKKRKKDEDEELEDEEEILYDEDGMPLVDLLGEEEDFEPITIVDTQEQKLKAQIKDLAESDPEIVAQLLKTWLS